jgi:outer membrane lipoprotein LolB
MLKRSLKTKDINLIRLLWITFLIAVITGCTTLAPLPPSSSKVSTLSWSERQKTLRSIQNWEIKGKLAAQTAQDSVSGDLDWIERHRQFTISLVGPFGTNRLTLTGQPGQVVLEMSNGKRISAENAEQLLADQWGYRVPVNNLYYWVRGLPVPGIPSVTEFDQFGRLSGLKQQGWQIQFSHYTTSHTIDLPGRIWITSPLLKVKIIIYTWSR